MMEQKTVNILLYNRSETILKGLYSIVNEIGIEPIIVRTTDDFFDYPHLLGYILVIISEDLIEEHQAFIEKHYKSAELIKFQIFSTVNKTDDGIYIEDSSAVIQNKIQQSISSFSDGNIGKQTQDLTPREIDVLKLVALGYTNKEIANTLFISTHTAISHRKNISEKLGIKTISGLTMYAVIKQIIEIKDINTDNLK